MDVSHVDVLSLMSADTRLKRVASTGGGEYAGSCPFCGGDDRFRAWPTPRRGDGRGRFWCRRCERHGDAIDYHRMLHGSSFADACKRLGVGLDGEKRPRRAPTREEPARAPIRTVANPCGWSGGCMRRPAVGSQRPTGAEVATDPRTV